MQLGRCSMVCGDGDDDDNGDDDEDDNNGICFPLSDLVSQSGED